MEAQRVVVLADDSFLVYGRFNQLNGVATGGLIKFHPDGSRDTSFHFAANYVEVTAVGVLSDGHLIVAAHHEEKSGRKSYEILRLTANGSIDNSFNAGTGADDLVNSITVQPNGKILVGGFFTSFSAAARPYLLRLNPTGTIDTTFRVISLAAETKLFQVGIWANIVVQADGKILIGGSFETVNGMSINNQQAVGLARLASDGSLDSTFVPSGYSVRHYNTEPPADIYQFYPIRALALDAKQQILAAGRFNSATDIVRLTSSGALQQRFSASDQNRASGTQIRAFSFRPNGDIIGAGYSLYRFKPDGTLVAGYDQHVFTGFGNNPASPVGYASSVAVQSNGKILVAGPRYVDRRLRSGVARFEADGKLDSFALGEFQRQTVPTHIASRSDAKTYVEGDFDLVDNIKRGGLARLNMDGTVDTDFDPATFGITNGGQFTLSPDDRVLIDGLTDDPYTYVSALRLNPDDSTDQTFQPDSENSFFDRPLVDNTGAYLNAVTQNSQVFLSGASNSRILVNGKPDSTYKGAAFPPHYGVVRDPNGNLTDLFVGDNRPLAVLPDGKFLMRYYDKTDSYHLIRLHHDGSTDATFHQGTVAGLSSYDYEFVDDYYSPDIQQAAFPRVHRPSPGISDVLLLADGKMIVVGEFSSYNTQAARGIVRLLADGTVDSAFKSGTGAQWTSTTADATHLPRIDHARLQTDGKLLITGNFETYDGTAVPGIARLNADGSIDKNFVAPVALDSDSPYGPFPISQLAPRPDGTYLLSGRYAAAGTKPARSLTHINTSDNAPVATPAPKATPTPKPIAQLLNISTRMEVLNGDNVLIGGFIITGDQPKKVLIRGLGPSLPVNSALADPVLELHDSTKIFATNDDWKVDDATDQSQATQIAATTIPPTKDSECALIAVLAGNNAAYTAVLRGKNGGTGVGQVEVYDLGTAANSQLANISTRGFIDTGDNVMIGGVIAGPNRSGSTKVLLRAIGPSLGIAGELADPTLELHNASGTTIGTNDNWKIDDKNGASQQAEIEATKVPPKSDLESALLETVTPGNYTAIVRGKNSSAGIGLVEVYNLP